MIKTYFIVATKKRDMGGMEKRNGGWNADGRSTDEFINQGLATSGHLAGTIEVVAFCEATAIHVPTAVKCVAGAWIFICR